MGQAIDRIEKQFISASAGMGRVDPATTRRLQEKRDADVKVLRDSWQDWLEKERRNILGKVFTVDGRAYSAAVSGCFWCEEKVKLPVE